MLLVLSWFFGLIGCGTIFGENNFDASFLTITIAICPIINFLFTISKIIIEAKKSCKHGQIKEDVEKIKKLFQENERKK